VRPSVKALAAGSLREMAAVSLRPGCGPAAIENRGYYYSSNVRHWDQTNLTKHNLVLPALHSGTDPSVGGCFVPPLVIGLRVHGASGRPTHAGKARADQAFEPSLESISPTGTFTAVAAPTRRATGLCGDGRFCLRTSSQSTPPPEHERLDHRPDVRHNSIVITDGAPIAGTSAEAAGSIDVRLPLGRRESGEPENSRIQRRSGNSPVRGQGRAVGLPAPTTSERKRGLLSRTRDPEGSTWCVPPT
jgi:hypothetical protein